MKQFEYLTTMIIEKHELAEGHKNEWKPEGLLQTKLNEFGRKGWELATLQKVLAHKHRTLYNAVFKREINETI